MRTILLVLAVVIAGAGVAAGQTPSPFADVPPWHWAFDAVQQGAAAGIFTGYPTTDPEHVANALAQVYEAFAHADHPAAQAWAEWFLANTPAAWPQPLQDSRLVRFTLSGVRVRVTGSRAAVNALAAATVRTAGGTTAAPAALAVAAERDTAGHWRIDYATLARAHPQVFR